MNIALWVVQGLLALVFIMAGGMKVMQPKEKLAENMGWVEDFSPNTIRLIGTLEILGGICIVLPALTGILPLLTPLAAVGLALDMIGAMITHLRRREYSNFGFNIVLLALAVFVAYGRFIVLP